MPLMVGHVCTRAYLYFFKLICFHGGNCSLFTGTMYLLQLLIMIAKYKGEIFDKCPIGYNLTEKYNRQILIFIDVVLNGTSFPFCNLKRI